MIISASFPVFSFDKITFTRTLDEKCQEATREATREYYRAIWPILAGSIDTGMTIGSLIPLGRYLNNVPVSFVPQSEPKQGYPKHEYPYGLKSPSSGEMHGREGEGFVFDTRNFHYEFIFSIEVFHYKINEVMNTHARNSPYHTIDKGKAAFKRRLLRANLSQALRKAFVNSTIKTIIEVAK